MKEKLYRGQFLILNSTFQTTKRCSRCFVASSGEQTYFFLSRFFYSVLIYGVGVSILFHLLDIRYKFWMGPRPSSHAHDDTEEQRHISKLQVGSKHMIRAFQWP